MIHFVADLMNNKRKNSQKGLERKNVNKSLYGEMVSRKSVIVRETVEQLNTRISARPSGDNPKTSPEHSYSQPINEPF